MLSDIPTSEIADERFARTFGGRENLPRRRDECLRRAEATKVEGVKESYLSLALSYIRIAEDMEAAAQARALQLAREMLTVTKN